jgi:hypothetical protein
MKKYFLLLIVLISVRLNAQTYFEKVFMDHFGPAYAREDVNDDLIISFSNQLSRMDATASTVLWNKTYSFNNIKFDLLSSGNIMFAANYPISFVCGLLDGNGDSIKINIFDEPFWDYTQTTELMEDGNGDFLFSVYQTFGAHGIRYFVKLNNVGDSITTNMNGGNDFCLSPSGNITTIENDIVDGAYLNQYNPAFNYVWSNHPFDTINHLPSYYMFNSVISTSSNMILVAGRTHSEQSILLFDNNGQLSNYYRYGSGQFNDIIQMQSGNYAAIGTDTIGTFLKFIDSNFNVLTTKYFYGLNYVDAEKIIETNDHGVLISGASYALIPVPPGGYFPWIVKTDSLGNFSPVGIEENNFPLLFDIKYLGNNMFEFNIEQGTKLEIWNLTGKKLETISGESPVFQYNGNHLSAGIYLFSLYRENHVLCTKKVIINKN